MSTTRWRTRTSSTGGRKPVTIRQFISPIDADGIEFEQEHQQPEGAQGRRHDGHGQLRDDSQLRTDDLDLELDTLSDEHGERIRQAHRESTSLAKPSGNGAGEGKKVHDKSGWSGGEVEMTDKKATKKAKKAKKKEAAAAAAAHVISHDRDMLAGDEEEDDDEGAGFSARQVRAPSMVEDDGRAFPVQLHDS